MQRTKPPFRADHVGSFLRSAAVKHARAKREKGEITRRRAQGGRGPRDRQDHPEAGGDRPAARDRRRVPPLLVAFRFLRRSTASSSTQPTTASSSTACRPRPRAPRHRQARLLRPSDARAFQVSEGAHQASTPKMTIPSPTVLHFRVGPNAVEAGHLSRSATPFFDDLARPTSKAVKAFYDAGCRYLQFDDTAWAYLCSQEELQKAQGARRRRRSAAGDLCAT